MKKAFIVVAILILLGAILVVAQGILFLTRPASTSTEQIVFEVSPGKSFKHVAADLESEKLITSTKKFEILARLTSATGRVRVGEYAIRRNMTPREILQVLASGKSLEHALTFQEGLNRWEMADIFATQGLGKKQEFLDATQDQALIQELLGETHESLEGYLFPETYYVTKFTGARGLVQTMVARFLEVYQELSAQSEVKLTRHQTAILASIVEKETGAPDERNLVSSVFHNRLKQGIRLQTDPTVIYGILDQGHGFSGNITKKDLLTPNRYNTYTLSGLPFGPIGNAGRDAIYATLHPAKTEFLYFVSRNDGTQVYSKNYDDHRKAVIKFQLDPRAREGKSWRDLHKKIEEDKRKAKEQAP